MHHVEETFARYGDDSELRLCYHDQREQPHCFKQPSGSRMGERTFFSGHI